MKTLSIEYAHIYTNESTNKELGFYSKITNELLKDYKRTDISLVVMVDDYSFPDPGFQYSHFLDLLDRISLKPDVFIRESQLIPHCDIVLGKINNEKLKKQITDYIIVNKKYPCSLFIATWYLVRLGCITTPLLPKKETAKKIINILPESFKPFEEKGINIIKQTEFKDLILNIENRYYEGRIIA